MKLRVLMIFMVFYLIQYEGYYFNPCSGNICFAISGYDVAPETIYCPTKDCVRESLKKKGKQHLGGIYEILFYPGAVEMIKFKQLKIVESYDFE